MKKIRLSKYTFIIDKSENEVILYNSVTGAIIKLDNNEYITRIKELNAQKIVSLYEEDEFIKNMLEFGFLVDAELSEDAFVRSIYEKNIIKQEILNLCVIVTRQCNLRCLYCYEEHKNLRMSLGIYENILKYIEKCFESKKYKMANITFFGGEPLLEYDSIVKFLEKAMKIADKYNCIIGSGMSTNGYLLEPERFEKLYTLNCMGYQITLDGISKTHDKFRPLVNGDGTWNKIINNLKYMQKTDYNFTINLRTNFNDEVYKNIADFYKYIGENFDERFSIYFEEIKRPTNNRNQFDVLNLTESAFTSIDISKMLKENNLINSWISQNTINCSRICDAAKLNHFAIDYNGNILKCTHVLDEPYNIIGKLEENGEMKIDERKQANWIAQGFENSEQCKNCKILPLCFGKKCTSNLAQGKELFCNHSIEEIKLIEMLKATF